MARAFCITSISHTYITLETPKTSEDMSTANVGVKIIGKVSKNNR